MPVTEDLERQARGVVGRPGVKARVSRSAARHAFFHWHTAFAEVMARGGGFDVVLGNPPWERIKLQEEEFFAIRSPRIAKAPNKAARQRLIDALDREGASPAERRLHLEFHAAKRESEAASSFIRRSGRFPLTSHGDINTYAVFAETCLGLLNERGRAGIIVPTGIATDHSTRRFFQSIVAKGRLASLVDFENRMKLFKGIDSRIKFCLLTLGRGIERPSYLFFATKTAHVRDTRRMFELTSRDMQLINPNTRTAPVFRSNADAGLAKKIYSHVPVLIDDTRGDEGNPWRVRFMRMFDMANDSGLFRTYRQLEAEGACLEGRDWTDSEGNVWLPLMEAKMIHHYDHRWATFEEDGRTLRLVTETEKSNPHFICLPRYWVPKYSVEKRLNEIGWASSWLLGWRDITGATNERTLIATLFPRCGVADNLLLMFCANSISNDLISALVANLSSLVLDFVVRLKVGGNHIKYFTMKQLPVLDPSSYRQADLDFIVPRVKRLIRNRRIEADTGFTIENREETTAVVDNDAVKAELDAYFTYLYGLNREDLQYILDPVEVAGVDCPSESFRVLKSKERKQFNEFRTKRLVLLAWDDLAGAL